MKTIIVTTQAELDALPSSFAEFTEIEIRADKATEIVVRKTPASSTVRAYGSSTVTPAVVQESLTTESATPGLRADNPMAEPVMGGLPRYDGEKLGTPANQQPTP